ncbi:carbonic anhydrase [Trichoderma austrokoningii]
MVNQHFKNILHQLRPSTIVKMASFTFPTKSTTFADLLRRNEENLDLAPVPLVSEAPQNAVFPSVAIFSCVDFRFNPEELFQIKKGEAFMFSTVGGNVRPCLNDLLFLETLLGNSLKDIIIIHHEDCGTTRVTSPMIQENTKTIAPALKEEIDIMQFQMHNGKDLEASVRSDLQFLRDSPYLRKELSAKARGFVFYLTENKLVEVKL